MSVEVVFETHALTEDNERGIATGWLPGRLSERGRVNAAAMGERRRDNGIAVVFTRTCAGRRRRRRSRSIISDYDVAVTYRRPDEILLA